jgi:hypothetical protein
LNRSSSQPIDIEPKNEPSAVSPNSVAAYRRREAGALEQIGRHAEDGDRSDASGRDREEHDRRDREIDFREDCSRAGGASASASGATPTGALGPKARSWITTRQASVPAATISAACCQP